MNLPIVERNQMDNFQDLKRIYEPIGYYRYTTKYFTSKKKIFFEGKVRKRKNCCMEFLIYGGAFIVIGAGLVIFLTL
jgi:hypothetical protein